MKKISIYCLIGVFTLLNYSCDDAIEAFSNTQNYIYFNLPFELDRYGKVTTKRVDSLVYSFAMDNIDVKSYTFKVPVNTVGLESDVDRKYDIVINDSITTAENTDWDQSILNNAIIRAGYLYDTLQVTVFRSDTLRSTWRSVGLKIVGNENFKEGSIELLDVKLSFTDILQPPSWWNSWISYFGVFSREKYIKWQEIYYLGADPNLEFLGPNTGKQLYWDNMPYYNIASWYPSTFMFISKLKQYFIENEVYPDGDTSKPRVQLP